MLINYPLTRSRASIKKKYCGFAAFVTKIQWACTWIFNQRMNIFASDKFTNKNR